jgi:lysophospholipase L1-like esterase
MNPRLFLSVVVVAVLATFATGAPSALADGSGATDANAVHYYVALGDSLADGYQPNGDVGHGYADQLYAALKAHDPTLQLENLACGGETTSSMISGVEPTGSLGSRYFCAPPGPRREELAHGSQLADAVAFLRAHSGFVSLITIDIGGNDVSPCLASADPECFQEGLTDIQTNLPQILAALQAAAPGVPIVGMTYYDVVAPICVSDPSLAFLCGEVDTLNASLSETYAGAGDPVADVAGAFENDDLAKAAQHVCDWTWFCSLGDVHANTAGYGVIAQAFAKEVLP